MNREGGFVLVVALAMALLVMVLGLASWKMGELGYIAYGSERSYQIASSAAEYAINSGVKHVVDNSTCPATGNCTGTMSAGGGTPSYSCFAVSSGNKCFIHGKGQFLGASVVKTVVVPFGGASDYGALTLRNGGTLQLGGSSSIANCDAGCPTPGVTYGGSVVLQISGSLYNATPCPNNPKGIYGTPYAVANGQGVQAPCANPSNCSFSSTVLPDLVPTAFQISESCRTSNDCWTQLVNAMAGTYNGHSVDVSTRSVSGMPARPTTPTPTCVCTNSSFTLTSSSSSCTGVADFSGCGGNIKFNGSSLTVQGIPSALTNIVAASAMTVSGVPSGSGSFSGKGLYTTSGAITINDSDVSLTNATVSAAAAVTLQTIGAIAGSTLSSSGSGSITLQSTGSMSNSNIISANGITMQSSVSSISGSQLLAEGSSGIVIQSNGGVSNSVFYTSNSSADVTVQGGTLSTSTIVTKDQVTFQSGTGSVTDTNIFAYRTIIQKGAGDIGGGILYTADTTTIQGTGGGTQQVGLEANPTLLLSGGNIVLQHTNGTTDFNGIVFTNGRIVAQSSGDYGIAGKVIANGTSSGSVFQSSGNAHYTYDQAVLQALATRLSSFVRSPACGGGGNVKPYIASSKMTTY
jgi:hypothetical protein